MKGFIQVWHSICNFYVGGKNVRSGKLEKIVGLDPAGVLFHHDKPDERLNSTDAKYVETIQTSKLGFVKPVGSVSFFPNGGRFQVSVTGF